MHAVGSFGAVINHTPLNNVKSFEKMVVLVGVPKLELVPQKTEVWIKGVAREVGIGVLGWIEEPLPQIPPLDTTPKEDFFAKVTRDNMQALARMGEVKDDREVITVDYQTLLAVWKNMEPGHPKKESLGATLKASPFFPINDKGVQGELKGNSPAKTNAPKPPKLSWKEKGKSIQGEGSIPNATGEEDAPRTGQENLTVGGLLSINDNADRAQGTVHTPSRVEGTVNSPQNLDSTKSKPPNSSQISLGLAFESPIGISPVLIAPLSGPKETSINPTEETQMQTDQPNSERPINRDRPLVPYNTYPPTAQSHPWLFVTPLVPPAQFSVSLEDALRENPNLDISHLEDDTGYDSNEGYRHPYQDFEDELAGYEVEQQPEEVGQEAADPAEEPTEGAANLMEEELPPAEQQGAADPMAEE